MQYRSRFGRALRQIGALIGLGWLLAMCQVEGGVPRPNATEAPASQPPTSSAAAVPTAAREDAWTIGLLDEPKSLYPYAESAGAQRVAAPLTELLFPSPILSLNYGYTNTGVLERIPSLENGDAQLRKADVYLDPTGIITTTHTDVITQVDQLVVTFRWNPKLRWSDGKPVTADDSVFAYELAKREL